jgi:hypothetical protein
MPPFAMATRVARWVAAFLGLAAFCPTGAAQNRMPVFRADSTLVLVPFHVSRDKQFVRNLTAAAVTVLEDGQPRDFQLYEAAPAPTILLLFDVGVGTEALMVPKAAILKEAILDRLPEARIAVYAYDHLLMPFCPPTRDIGELDRALNRVLQFGRENPRAIPWTSRRTAAAHPTGQYYSLPPDGSIPIERPGEQMHAVRDIHSLHYPAISAAARTMAEWPGDGPRAILVFSSGRWAGEAFWLDMEERLNFSPRPEDASAAALQVGISLFPFVVEEHTRIDPMAKINPLWAAEVRRQHDVLRQLGEATGGLAFTVSPEQTTLGATRQNFIEVAEYLVTRYIAAFQPGPAAAEPRRHRVEVRLRPEEVGSLQGGFRMVVH